MVGRNLIRFHVWYQMGGATPTGGNASAVPVAPGARFPRHAPHPHAASTAAALSPGAPPSAPTAPRAPRIAPCH